MASVNPLEAWRRHTDLTAAGAARALNVSRKQWYEWVAGTALPTPSRSELILRETGVSRSALLQWQEGQGVSADAEQVAV
jgi:hypothetical protein